MIGVNEIEKLGFTNLGSRWFKNADDTIRIRQWRDFQIDIWEWKDIEDERMILFRGKLTEPSEIQWILDRI